MSATATRERPIIFSAESVRAILRGDKTQTRRVLKMQPPADTVRLDPWLDTVLDDWQYERGRALWASTEVDGTRRRYGCPYGIPGDRLWVREAFYRYTGPDMTQPDRLVRYRADEETTRDRPGEWSVWMPVSPLYMPRVDSRLTLALSGVRAERLQDISELDAYAEGYPRTNHLGDRFGYYISDGKGNAWNLSGATAAFAAAWNNLNQKRGYGWDTNPWVWVITFGVAR